MIGYDDGRNRYRVIKYGFFYKVKIGNGEQTVGKCFTRTGAEKIAAGLLTAYRDGIYMSEKSLCVKKQLGDLMKSKSNIVPFA